MCYSIAPSVCATVSLHAPTLHLIKPHTCAAFSCPLPRCSRQQVERRLSLSANALTALWRRLQLLAEAVRDQGAVLEAPELAKEREDVAGMVARMNDGQVRIVILLPSIDHSVLLVKKMLRVTTTEMREACVCCRQARHWQQQCPLLSTALTSHC